MRARAHKKMVLEVFNALNISMSDTYRVEESWEGWQNFCACRWGRKKKKKKRKTKQRGAQLSSSSSSYSMRPKAYYVCIQPSPKALYCCSVYCIFITFKKKKIHDNIKSTVSLAIHFSQAKGGKNGNTDVHFIKGISLERLLPQATQFRHLHCLAEGGNDQ